jgi:glycosyltransferase involved in cell wall biosynthesis
MWLTLIFGGTAAIFLAMTTSVLWHLRWVRRLPAIETFLSQNPTASGTGLPIQCSVVIAARNEEARIDQTIRRLLAQRGLEVEVIVVDDRSTDRTGEILRGLAQENPRVQAKRVNVLPDGWLGKCHACHLGASAAKGEWILFTDADCWLTPDTIARALRLADREGVDHIALTSGLATRSPGLETSHLAFLLSLANWFSGVNRDRPKSYLGIGAFNLVRAAAYRQCGGYEALRLTVVDDVKLGLLLRRAGKRTRAYLGADDVECHWGDSLRSMVKIMEKNYFAVLEFRLWLVLLGSAFAILLLCILTLGLLTGTAAGIAAAVSPLSSILPAGILARRLGWSWRSAVFVPLMIPVFLYMVLNSTFVTLRQGGVRWRDTFYSIAALRAGGVR